MAIVGRLGVHPMVRLTLPARRVMAFLALHDEPVSRPTAAGRLWPDIVDSQARSNLRRSLWQVPQSWVRSVGDELSLDAVVDYPDARRIAAAALQGAPLDLGAIELLSEDLLPGWHEEWVIPAQNSFRMLRVQALEAACRSMTASGDHALATQAGMAALAGEPLSESAAEALISAYLSQGNRYAAARCFHEFCIVLREELQVEPDAQLSSRLAESGIPPE
ncbi:BTAD domain-containing putative transcriptional regulator [Agromyces sp. NPDC058126]|uniref:AfsR/SARP family transcriptional regulator n=1 Tax=Agromyces sp. NPDC058126 TaxID=3346350 RepID=UPI0036D7840F